MKLFISTVWLLGTLFPNFTESQSAINPYGTWFIFGQHDLPSIKNKEDGWMFLDSVPMNILDGIYNAIRFAYGEQEVDPLKLNPKEDLCVHLVDYTAYEQNEALEFDRLLDTCSFVPASKYIFYFSFTGYLETPRPFLANLINTALMMNKILVTDVEPEKLRDFGGTVRQMPYLSREQISQDDGWLSGVSHSPRTSMDLLEPLIELEGSEKENELNQFQKSIALLLLTSPLSHELQSFDYYKKDFRTKVWFHHIHRTLAVRTNMKIEDIRVLELDEMRVKLTMGLMMKHPGLEYNVIFPRVMAEAYHSKHGLMQTRSSKIFLLAEFSFGYNSPMVLKEYLSLQRYIWMLGNTMRITDRDSLRESCFRQFKSDSLKLVRDLRHCLLYILGGNYLEENQKPTTWEDCNENNKSCSADPKVNDSCLWDHEEVLRAPCYLMKIAKLTKLKERLTIQKNSSTISELARVNNASSPAFGYFFQDKAYLPGTKLAIAGVPNITEPGFYTVDPKLQCALDQVLFEGNRTLGVQKTYCMVSMEQMYKTFSPSAGIIFYQKLFWAFVTEILEDYYKYKIGVYITASSKSLDVSVPLYEDLDTRCQFWDVSKPIVRAKFTVETIKAWRYWVPLSHYCSKSTITSYSIENPGANDSIFGFVGNDEFDTKIASLDRGYEVANYIFVAELPKFERETLNSVARSCMKSSRRLQQLSMNMDMAMKRPICVTTCQEEWGFVLIDQTHQCADCAVGCKYDLVSYPKGSLCLPCPAIYYSLPGMDGCAPQTMISMSEVYFTVVVMVLVELLLCFVLFIIYLLKINSDTPIVKASSVPISKFYTYGQASALCGVWIVCCSQSITACSIYRILVPFGEVSIMMSLALYSARLRLMASSSNRSSNTCFKCVSKCFDALGHANAVKFVPLVVYTIQLVIVLLLFHWIPETNNVKLARGLSNGEEGFYQYRICDCFAESVLYLIAELLSTILLIVSTFIGTKSEAVSDFLRQDRQMLYVLLIFVYCKYLTGLFKGIASGYAHVQFFAIIIPTLVSYWLFVIILWKKRVNILLVNRHLNTREYATKSHSVTNRQLWSARRRHSSVGLSRMLKSIREARQKKTTDAQHRTGTLGMGARTVKSL